MTKMTEKMNKTETTKRLRTLTRLAREAEGMPANAPVEVGTRNYPVNSTRVPTQDECYPEGDDLFDIGLWNFAVDEAWMRTPGAVVHLYVSTPGSLNDRELIGVCVGWMGYEDEEPRLIDVDGRAVSLGRCSFYDCDKEAKHNCFMCKFVLCDDHATVRGSTAMCAGMRHY